MPDCKWFTDPCYIQGAGILLYSYGTKYICPSSPPPIQASSEESRCFSFVKDQIVLQHHSAKFVRADSEWCMPLVLGPCQPLPLVLGPCQPLVLGPCHPLVLGPCHHLGFGPCHPLGSFYSRWRFAQEQ
uniref:Uncharacterized protein n=1 Tax=Eptatretus burgeri TaxID=7764 RepID=A0A8C4PY09_EPTBU